MTSRIARLSGVFVALVTTCAFGQTSPAIATSPNASESRNVRGDIAEMTALLKSAVLAELRTTYNGSYGASVFFLAQELTYYVTLFQDKSFWRVVKTQDRTRANSIYAIFTQQTERLSKVEIEQIELAAQKQSLDHMIALAENSANRMRADLDIARQQQAFAAERQLAAQTQTRALSVEKQAAQIQLGNLRSQVHQLREQAEMGLPPTSTK
jgi:hypothetical protein